MNEYGMQYEISKLYQVEAGSITGFESQLTADVRQSRIKSVEIVLPYLNAAVNKTQREDQFHLIVLNGLPAQHVGHALPGLQSIQKAICVLIESLEDIIDGLAVFVDVHLVLGSLQWCWPFLHTLITPHAHFPHVAVRTDSHLQIVYNHIIYLPSINTNYR